MDYLGLAFKKTYSEHLNEENKVSNSGTGRGVTKHPAEFSYKIEKDKKNKKCTLILKGGIKLSVYVLKKGHPLYKKHQKRYNKKWGEDRNDDKEREAVIAHEYDHRDTYTDLFDKGLSKLNTKYDGKVYDNSKAANEAGKEAVKEAKRLYKKAVEHSKRFDEAGRNYGGAYTTYPFNVN